MDRVARDVTARQLQTGTSGLCTKSDIQEIQIRVCYPVLGPRLTADSNFPLHKRRWRNLVLQFLPKKSRYVECDLTILAYCTKSAAAREMNVNNRPLTSH